MPSNVAYIYVHGQSQQLQYMASQKQTNQE